MITTATPPATIQELKAIEIVKNPNLGNRWQGVQHGELVETIHTILDSNSIGIESEAWYPSGKFDSRLNGKMRLNIPGMEPVPGTSFSLGIQHSNYGEHALKFAVGAEVFICSNGMVVGDYAVKRKHTTGMDLPALIDTGIETYLDMVQEVPRSIQTMQTIGMARSDVDRALMQAGRDGILCWSRIGQVDAEYHKPTFAEHNQDTAWGLYNAFTYVLQKTPPQYHIRSMNRFRQIVIGENAECN